MSLKDDILRAARADSIPAGESGLWSVRKWNSEILGSSGMALQEGKMVRVKPGHYTSLMRVTVATMHNNCGGECVMTDTENELRTHLDFMLRARGRVLKTGLGLGCVVRGLLVNPAVESVTVIERDRHVLKLVGPHMPKERVRIIEADAIEWCKATDQEFDCAWHDIWSDEDAGEDKLCLLHSALICAMNKKVKHIQGAWAFPRFARKQFGLI